MTKVAVCVKVDNGEIGPFDAAALETALRIPASEVTIVCMAAGSAEPVLNALLRLGVQRAILLCDSAFAGADTLATSYALSLALQKLNPDLVLCGRQSMSGDTAQIGPSIAARLHMNLIPYAMSLQLHGNSVICDTRSGTMSAQLPALVAVERIHTLRLPRALGRSNGAFEIWDAKTISADIARCGHIGSKTRVISTYESSHARRRCEFVQMSALPALIETHRAISGIKPLLQPSDEKLSWVWGVGDAVLDMATTVSDNVEIVPCRDILQRATLARERPPDAILFPADAWGRVTATQLAVALDAGLCADCTSLEVDGGDLIMVRPAQGGRLTGKIRCLSKPALATLRVAAGGDDDMILSIGRGAVGLETLAALCAQRLKAELAASRGAVDRGLAPYSAQVGLTGRHVSPNIYLALGISGAIAHTCAIESCGCVIAVNRDADARIFEYADFGVVGETAHALAVLHKGDNHA